MKYNTKFANKNYLIQKNYTEEIKKVKNRYTYTSILY
ncbi:putative glycosyl transferase, group 1 (plasmid) [Brachyspira hyodysenteriae]|nr:putative glycosyl transferase, group 1 [Brachyspira hyodysenteriae]